MLPEGKHKYKCKQCFAKITLDIFPQPYMTVTQNEYAEKLYTEIYVKSAIQNKNYLKSLKSQN